MRTVQVALGVAVVLGIAGAVALAEDDLNVTASSDFFSKYVWRGQNIVDDWVAQPSVSAAYKGFTGSVWSNFDLTDENSRGGKFTEFDYSLDYTASIPDVNVLSFSFGGIYYRLPHTGSDPTTEVYGGLAADVLLTPSIKVYHDVESIKGTYIQLSLGHAIEKVAVWTPECYCDLQLGASLGYGTAKYNEGYFDVRSGRLNDLTLSAVLPVCLGHWTIKPTLGFSTMLDSSIRDATEKSDNFWAGVGVTYSF